MPFPISSSSSDTLSTSSNSSESTELLPTSSTEVLSTSSSTEVLGCCTNDFDGDGAITAIDQLMYKAYLEVTAVKPAPRLPEVQAAYDAHVTEGIYPAATVLYLPNPDCPCPGDLFTSSESSSSNSNSSSSTQLMSTSSVSGILSSASSASSSDSSWWWEQYIGPGQEVCMRTYEKIYDFDLEEFSPTVEIGTECVKKGNLGYPPIANAWFLEDTYDTGCIYRYHEILNINPCQFVSGIGCEEATWFRPKPDKPDIDACTPDNSSSSDGFTEAGYYCVVYREYLSSPYDCTGPYEEYVACEEILDPSIYPTECNSDPPFESYYIYLLSYHGIDATCGGGCIIP